MMVGEWLPQQKLSNWLHSTPQGVCYERNRRNQKTRSVNTINFSLQNTSSRIYFRNILRSILLGVPFVTIFYVLINMSYMTVLTVPEIITGGPVALNFAERIFGSYAPIMPLGVAVSAFGCAMAMQFVFAR